MTASDHRPGTTAAFVRFLAVGGSFALIHAVVTALLINRAGVAPVPASVVVWIALIPPAYVGQRRLAFGLRRARRGAFLLYAATQAVGVLIVATTGWLFVRHEFVWDTGVYLAASALAAVVSFAVARLVTFAPGRA